MARATNKSGKAALAGTAGVLAVLALGLAGGPALAGDKDAASDAYAKCARIDDGEARLACFDAVTTALKGRGAAVAMPARKPAQATDAAAERRAREQDAAMEAREAELARREAELEARQAAAQAAFEAAEAAAQAAQTAREQAQQAATEAAVEAEKRAREAQRLAEEAAERAREAARSNQQDARSTTQDDRPRGGFFGLLGGGVPETSPETFGANDLDEEKFAALAEDTEIKPGDDLRKITAKAVRFGFNNAGKAFVELESGAIWRATRAQKVYFDKDGPNTVEIRRAALGSYLMRVNGRGKAIRVRRIK